MDLHRLPPDAPALDRVPLPASLAPAAPRAVDAPVDTLPRAPLPAPRPYGIGPRRRIALPFGAASVDGAAGGILVHDADPVGRLALSLAAAHGAEGTERGAAASATWRGWRPALEASAFLAAPGTLHGDDYGTTIGGGSVALANAWTVGRLSQGWRLGASAGSVRGTGADGARWFGFGRYAARASRRGPSGAASATLDVSAAAGRTAGAGWGRAMVEAGFGVGLGGTTVRVDGMLGRMTEDAPAWERFSAGGLAPMIVPAAVLPQRVPVPALRRGALAGDRIAAYRLGLPMGGVTPYFWGGSTDPRWNAWTRLAGLEAAGALPAFSAAGTPPVRVLAGIAYVLDGPEEHDVRGYLSLAFDP